MSDETSNTSFDALRESILERLDNVYVSYDGQLEQGKDILHLLKNRNPFILRKKLRNRFIKRCINTPISIEVRTSTEIDKIKDKVTSVVEVPIKTKEAFTEALRRNIDHLRNAFVMEFAPLSLGFPSAVEEAVEVLNIITEGDVQAKSFNRMSESFLDILHLKFILFISQHLKLPEEIKADLVRGYISKIHNSPQPSSPNLAGLLNAVRSMSKT